ncbi:MAG: glycoside hydrolase family 3 protein [Lachnospiraceae bacterium]|nr:glycoside hydrolase family 3 protein [Lachnospiraceae bacterium]
MDKFRLDMERYKSLARQAIAEGCVLLENENNALPIKKDENVAVFGRSAFNYYKSGLGSGGLVNTEYTVSILDALKDCSEITVNNELLNIYEDWLKEHPYDEGTGWGNVPWSQEEMPVNDRMLEIAKDADVSLVIIGRTAGEEQDNKAASGSFLLTKEEENLIKGVCANSDRSVIIINSGNIIDMSFVKKYHPNAVIYVWQGGQEGGNGTLDVLMGRVSPCGKLTDTIAVSIDDYPSTANFGSETGNYYKEDIYVGYRYFETFAKDKVLYPFGYGLSYSTFSTEGRLAAVSVKECKIEAVVKNTGAVAGKETLQVYVKVPQGKLGNPARKLAAFAKTGVLEPGGEEKITLVIPKYDFASYDDSGVTGHKSCYVLEEGEYGFYIGTDVRSAVLSGSYEQEFEVVEQLDEEMAPVEGFERIKPVQIIGEERYKVVMEAVPLKSYSYIDKYNKDKKEIKELPYRGDKGYKLIDVLDNKISMEDFVSQLDDDDLINIFRGEGMCSPRVTPGTAAAFGGVTDRLNEFGIPAICCSDGPSGIRMDCGSKAFLIPNGTALGCTFNPELIRELFTMLGMELRLNKIDALLGPGMNIHRNPLNGRNFEYISEDPYLTGKIAAAQVEAMGSIGIAGTIKHFCANNQEKERRYTNSVISERALREIYLKGFEIVVKSGHARSVMSTYGPVNGIWTAGNYELNTRILRKEWGYKGIVMSDWWAEANYDGSSAVEIKAPMAGAQNDVYMCVNDSASNPEGDDMKKQLESGYITRGQLQRNAINILGFILQSPAILRAEGRISKEEEEAMADKASQPYELTNLAYYEADKETDEIVIDGKSLHAKAGEADTIEISVNKSGNYSITFILKSNLGFLAQLPVSLFVDNIFRATVSIQGIGNKTFVEKRALGFLTKDNNSYVRIYYGANGIEVEKVVIKPEDI